MRWCVSTAAGVEGWGGLHPVESGVSAPACNPICGSANPLLGIPCRQPHTQVEEEIDSISVEEEEEVGSEKLCPFFTCCNNADGGSVSSDGGPVWRTKCTYYCRQYSSVVLLRLLLMLLLLARLLYDDLCNGRRWLPGVPDRKWPPTWNNNDDISMSLAEYDESWHKNRWIVSGDSSLRNCRWPSRMAVHSAASCLSMSCLISATSSRMKGFCRLEPEWRQTWWAPTIESWTSHCSNSASGGIWSMTYGFKLERNFHL